jgi:hypothetical protein
VCHNIPVLCRLYRLLAKIQMGCSNIKASETMLDDSLHEHRQGGHSQSSTVIGDILNIRRKTQPTRQARLTYQNRYLNPSYVLVPIGGHNVVLVTHKITGLRFAEARCIFSHSAVISVTECDRLLWPAQCTQKNRPRYICSFIRMRGGPTKHRQFISKQQR